MEDLGLHTSCLLLLKDGGTSVYVTSKRIRDEILPIPKPSDILFTQENVLEIAMSGLSILISSPAPQSRARIAGDI